MSIVGSGLVLIFGAALTSCSLWLLFHISDKKLLRRWRPRVNVKMSKSDTEAHRQLDIALLAMVLMVMGAICLIGGVMGLAGS